ncbi:hypothetical protein B2D45_06870 [Lactobacillus hilgardii]|uniref:Uncharacterized protein n=1 Tax=Lentilactobacillus hilgardii (strain ATCC 8290 / DSM 20176 / CCUG 30140 / JCM 1155 / KCTC 3500 / NBRC 15886 / NCIMB 8040 / NRRL B-1843 / 9) TaxID=1423757 RepID=C0XIE2_LENH9|nr:hypothetical protein HMPREF0497_0231 [Lentilactobacillus buchneri ATCC 11577]EEI24849.1 hypothetical protein HMPREF0519_1003 [Lentilactobacillus hilgardii DSM 20176 = ATCC 8290]MCT3397308.1 hypothetical protein [Lentilactobacillus hilgardii]QEU39675.1 hypothetical protein LH500_12805 [Lentilactobacillus hilgardii]
MSNYFKIIIANRNEIRFPLIDNYVVKRLIYQRFNQWLSTQIHHKNHWWGRDRITNHILIM